MELIEEIKFTYAGLPAPARYECCTFENCDWENTDLSGYQFNECTFINCNLSLCALVNTQFQDTHFVGCKMLGLSFDQLSKFSMDYSFEKCILDHSLFSKCNLKKIKFQDCTMKEVDFTSADLTSATFDACNLDRAIFYNTKLLKADLHTSFNFQIHPEHNQLKGAQFSIEGLQGLLSTYQINIIR